MSTSAISKVDIAICTWNRAVSLAQTLDSVSQLIVPAAIELNVLVVDNNSTDQTPDVIQQFEEQVGDRVSVVPLKEGNQGHTFSRNTAIDAAEGELVLWTDDDVILAPDWILQYVEVANAQPEISFWGSRIEPKFENETPTWIRENWDALKGCFAHRDLGEQPMAFTESRLPYGANFAIRTSVQKQFRFSTELGRRGDEVLGEDELDLFRRLIAAGHRGNWVPGALVEHLIPAERATERYVYDYFVGQGAALVAKGEAWHQDAAKLKSESRSEYAKYKLKRSFANSKTWVSHMLCSALAEGQFRALRP